MLTNRTELSSSSSQRTVVVVVAPTAFWYRVKMTFQSDGPSTSIVPESISRRYRGPLSIPIAFDRTVVVVDVVVVVVAETSDVAVLVVVACCAVVVVVVVEYDD